MCKKRKINIYEDPYTRENLEGDAKIIKDLGLDEHGLHHYLVHFDGDEPGKNVERFVVEALAQA
jgi:hypothetical protein